MGVRNAATYLGIHGPGLIGQNGRPNGSTLPAAAMPPRLGQDTDRVLQELLGLDAARLAELRRQGVI